VDGPGSTVPYATFSVDGKSVGRAGGDGRFEIFVDEPGEVRLDVGSSSHVGAEVTVTAPAEDVVVELSRGLSISGRVTFPDGKPAPGVLVASGSGSRRTGEDGRYELSGFRPEDRRVEVRCTPDDERRIVRAGETGVDFTVEEHVVRIRVVDERGRPFRRCKLELDGYRDGDRFFGLSAFLRTGTERTVDLPTGTELRILPSAPGREKRTRIVEITGEPRVHDIEVVLGYPPPPGGIEIVATDAEGKPLAFVIASLLDSEGWCVAGVRDRRIELDGKGRGRLGPVPAGRFLLVVSTVNRWWSTEGYGLLSEQQVRVPSGGVALVLTRILEGGRIRLTTRSVNGKIVAPRSVEIHDLKGRRLNNRFVRENPDGSYSERLNQATSVLLAHPLPPGRYRVLVFRGEEVVGEAEVPVNAGGTTDLEIRVE
jgi:hypothetical protein